MSRNLNHLTEPWKITEAPSMLDLSQHGFVHTLNPSSLSAPCSVQDPAILCWKLNRGRTNKGVELTTTYCPSSITDRPIIETRLISVTGLYSKNFKFSYVNFKPLRRRSRKFYVNKTSTILYVGDLGNFYINKNPYVRDLGHAYAKKKIARDLKNVYVKKCFYVRYLSFLTYVNINIYVGDLLYNVNITLT